MHAAARAVFVIIRVGPGSGDLSVHSLVAEDCICDHIAPTRARGQRARVDANILCLKARRLPLEQNRRRRIAGAVQHGFLQRCERQLGLRGVRLGKAARDWLSNYSWPGNVRELEHAISRAIVKALSSGQARERIIELNAQHLGAESPAAMTATPAARIDPVASALSLQDALDHYRREIVEARLREHGGQLAATARSLGLDRGNFHRLLKRLESR